MSDSTTPQDDAAMSPASTGSVAEPVAWEVFLPGVGTYDIHSFRWEAAAIAHALLANEGAIAAVCPLFRQPQSALTEAEREALEVALVWVNPERQDTLRGLLERLG